MALTQTDGSRALYAASRLGQDHAGQQGGTLLYSRLRYFDPEAPPRRPAARMWRCWSMAGAPTASPLTFVNISPSEARSVIVQGGAYGEHQIVAVSDGKDARRSMRPSFPLRLAPGAGARLTIRMKRFANDPTLSFPWEDTVADLGNPPPLSNPAEKAD